MLGATQQAAVEVEELLFRDHPDVVDADLADYFGSIPHSDLLKSVARRVVDRRVLHLIKMPSTVVAACLLFRFACSKLALNPQEIDRLREITGMSE